jgi:hypothetical protein
MTTKLQLLEIELEILKEGNNGFPLPKEVINIPELSEKTKRILLRFALWLAINNIELYGRSSWEYGNIFKIFKKDQIGLKLTPSEKLSLQEIRYNSGND